MFKINFINYPQNALKLKSMLKTIYKLIQLRKMALYIMKYILS